MTIRIVRLGSPRHPEEGLRIGTVRRPPRGVRREHFARDDWFDVWLPVLAPTQEDVKLALAARSDGDWRRFAQGYRRHMDRPDARHLLELLAALSRTTNFAVGCYCENPARCHRSLLGQLFERLGADVVSVNPDVP